MATLSVETISVSGIDATMNAVSASDVFTNNGKTWVYVNNASGSPDTVSITTPATEGGLAIADGGGSVPAGESRHFGPFPGYLFNNSSGQVTVTHTQTTSVTMAVISLP